MEKIIASRHFHVYDKVKQRILGELDALEAEFAFLTSARVVLDHQKNIFTAEITVHGRRMHIDAHAKAEGLDAAIDAMFNKAERQMRKHYDKQKNHHHESLSQIERKILSEQDHDEDEILSA